MSTDVYEIASAFIALGISEGFLHNLLLTHFSDYMVIKAMPLPLNPFKNI